MGPFVSSPRNAVCASKKNIYITRHASHDLLHSVCKNTVLLTQYLKSRTNKIMKSSWDHQGDVFLNLETSSAFTLEQGNGLRPSSSVMRAHGIILVSILGPLVIGSGVF